MAVRVNPPPQTRIPDQFFNDPELRKFFEDWRTILFQLWNRTGGSTDAIDDTEQALTSGSSRQYRNSAKINSLEKLGFDVEIITADFTTSQNQIVICRNTTPITVTLDPNAIEEDIVHIKRMDAKITVIGAIDGDTNKVINVKYFSQNLVFDGTEWAQI